jgi:hypothetical protein
MVGSAAGANRIRGNEMNAKTITLSKTSPQQYNRELLLTMARKMGALRERVVFTGGTALPLLLSDPDVQPIRFAKDVDVIFSWSDKKDLYDFEDGLWDLGFEKRSSGAVTRWRLDDWMLDVLPADPATVGFNARWFGEAWQSATPVELAEQLTVKVISSPALIATKLSAFLRRGRGNHFTSSDIADVLLLCGGRSQVTAEIASYPDAELKKFVKEQLKPLQANLAGNAAAASQGRFLKWMRSRALEQGLDRIGKIAAK